MASCLFLCAVFFACVFAAYSLEYSDIEDLRVQSCPSKNSCPRISRTYNNRICECDSSCSFYNDCCIDSPRVRSGRVTTQICMQFGPRHYEGVYAIADCPATYDGPEEVLTHCRKGNPRDPTLSAPVTDRDRNRTYLNSYCAVCHGASTKSLVTWLISACTATKPTWDDIIYSEKVQKWGSVQDGEFKPCDIMFDKPPGIEKNVRLCRSNLVSSCPKGYTRATYRRACDAYMSVVLGAGTTLYRNPHCALCNGVNPGVIKCFDPSNVELNRRQFSFALLLDVNRRDGDMVGVRDNNCASGQKYDPFFKKCRNLVCAIPGYTMVNSRCVKQ